MYRPDNSLFNFGYIKPADFEVVSIRLLSKTRIFSPENLSDKILTFNSIKLGTLKFDSSFRKIQNNMFVLESF